MKKSCIYLSLSVFTLLVLSSCYNCVECINCADEANNVAEICYDEGRPYYRNRQEWREDVKTYERLNQCECQ